MSRIVEYAQEFLESGGDELGYDENTMPESSDIDVVLQYHVPVWEYNGMTEEEWYGKNK